MLGIVDGLGACACDEVAVDCRVSSRVDHCELGGACEDVMVFQCISSHVIR